jgi:hypothetical protein
LQASNGPSWWKTEYFVSDRIADIRVSQLTPLAVNTSDVQFVNDIESLGLFGAAAGSDLLLLAPVAIFTLFPPFAPPAFL